MLLLVVGCWLLVVGCGYGCLVVVVVVEVAVDVVVVVAVAVAVAAAAAAAVGGVFCVDLPTLYELCAGERLVLEKAVPRYLRASRSISVSAVPFGPGTDIWRSCRYIGALFRALVGLLGGIRRFVSCDVGANHCRVRHIRWGKVWS